MWVLRFLVTYLYVFLNNCVMGVVVVAELRTKISYEVQKHKTVEDVYFLIRWETIPEPTGVRVIDRDIWILSENELRELGKRIKGILGE